MDEVKILDLDDIVPSERQIKINGKVYRIRGDATVEETLTLAKLQNSINTEEGINQIFEAIKSFFIDEIDIKVLKTLGIQTQLPLLITFLFGSENNKDIKKKITE